MGVGVVWVCVPALVCVLVSHPKHVRQGPGAAPREAPRVAGPRGGRPDGAKAAAHRQARLGFCSRPDNLVTQQKLHKTDNPV